MEDQVHEFILLGKDEDNIETYKSNISKTIAQVPNIEVIVEEDQQPKDEKNVLVDIRTWWEASPDIYNMMGMRDVATGLFLGIIFFIAGFGIFEYHADVGFEERVNWVFSKPWDSDPTR